MIMIKKVQSCALLRHLVLKKMLLFKSGVPNDFFDTVHFVGNSLNHSHIHSHSYSHSHSCKVLVDSRPLCLILVGCCEY